MGKIISLMSVFLWLALCGFCTEHYIKKRLPCYDPLSFPFHPKKYRREPVCFSPNINGCASPVLWYASRASESNQNSVQNVCCAVAPRITVMSLGQGSAGARSSFCWAGMGFSMGFPSRVSSCSRFLENNSEPGTARGSLPRGFSRLWTRSVVCGGQGVIFFFKISMAT